MEVGGCKNPRRKDALKRHVAVTPGTALLCSRPARCTRSAASSPTEDGPRRERQTRRAWEEGKKVTPIPRPGGSRRASLPGHVREGRSQGTGQGGDTPRAPLRARRPSEAVRLPGLEAPRASVPGPPGPERRLRRGEGGAGRRGGGDGDGGGERRARGRGRSPSGCRGARAEAPEPRERRFPRTARA